MQNSTWIFIQDRVSSHFSNIVQEFLKERLRKKFIKSTESSASSPYSNPLVLTWDEFKEKIYEHRFGRPFENLSQLKRKIKNVWPEVANYLTEIG